MSPVRYPGGSKPTANASVFTYLLLVIQQILEKVLTGAGAGLLAPFAALAELMGLRWDQVDNHDAAIVDLQDQTQVLEGVIGHGTRYMSTSPGVTTSPKTMPFDVRVGPLVGVTLQSGGKFRLDSKGLWDFHAQCEFTGGFLCPPEVYMDIVVRNPAGVEVGRRKAKGSSQDPVTVYNYYSYTIPSAGYTVEIQAWTASLPALGNWRGISGGLQTTGFSARKISAEVD